MSYPQADLIEALAKAKQGQLDQALMSRAIDALNTSKEMPVYNRLENAGTMARYVMTRLGELRATNAIPVLGDLLFVGHFEHAAATALGKMGSREAIPALLKRLDYAPTSEVLRALADIGDPSVCDTILEHLATYGEVLTYRALKTLTVLRDRRAIPILREHIKSGKECGDECGLLITFGDPLALEVMIDSFWKRVAGAKSGRCTPSITEAKGRKWTRATRKHCIELYMHELVEFVNKIPEDATECLPLLSQMDRFFVRRRLPPSVRQSARRAMNRIRNRKSK